MYYDNIHPLNIYEYEDYISPLTTDELEDIINYISYEMIDCSGEKFRILQNKLYLTEYLLDKVEYNNA